MAGANPLAVSPAGRLWSHSPFGMAHTPGRIDASSEHGSSIEAWSFQTRTVALSTSPRGTASSGWIDTTAGGGANSPNMLLIVLAVAGLISVSG